MRQKLIAALSFITLLLAAGRPAQALEVIESFHSDITLDKSGRMTVTETIQVNAENNRIRHGIYRDFPLTFTGDDGQMHRVDFSVIGITRDGAPEKYKSASIDNGTRIVIGKDDVIVPPGEHIYEIKYETGRQIRYFPDHD